MNAAQALLREVLRTSAAWDVLDPDLLNAIQEELERADDPHEEAVGDLAGALHLAILDYAQTDNWPIMGDDFGAAEFLAARILPVTAPTPDTTDPGPRILPITAYRATHPTPTDGVEPDSPRGRYTYPPPDPRLRGLRFEAEEG
jgi:hypothetical protein